MTSSIICCTNLIISTTLIHDNSSISFSRNHFALKIIWLDLLILRTCYNLHDIIFCKIWSMTSICRTLIILMYNFDYIFSSLIIDTILNWLDFSIWSRIWILLITIQASVIIIWVFNISCTCNYSSWTSTLGSSLSFSISWSTNWCIFTYYFLCW